jgi:chemotaxis protein methyltransferase CheR
MVLDDHARKHPGFTYTIHATDISTRVLSEARGATYHEELVEPVPAEWRKRYLLRSRDRKLGVVRIVPELRERVTFERLNFMDEHYALRGPFDVVFFRNVLIYFDRPTREAVLRRQCAHLRRGGHLFVGHSESLSDLSVPLVAEGSSVWRRT